MSYLVGRVEVFISRVLLLVPPFLLETCGYSPFLINPPSSGQMVYCIHESMLMYCEHAAKDIGIREPASRLFPSPDYSVATFSFFAKVSINVVEFHNLYLTSYFYLSKSATEVFTLLLQYRL